MKKNFSLLLILVMIVTSIGCGEKNPGGTDDTSGVLNPENKIFVDYFGSSKDLETYTVDTADHAAVKDGVLKLSGAVTAERELGTVNSGKFGFAMKTNSLTDAQYGLTSEGKSSIILRAKKDGSLCWWYRNNWHDFAPAGTVKVDTWHNIEIDLVEERNVNYARVNVDGEYVGMALYDKMFTDVNALYFGVTGTAEVLVDNVWADESDGIRQMPDRTESDPIVYVPEVVESRAMVLFGDSNPANGVLGYAVVGEEGTLDINRNSFGVDLGEKQAVNALRITSTRSTEFQSDLSNYTVWISDDNAIWTQIHGFTYNSFIDTDDTTYTALFEFSGVETRYVKVNTDKKKTKGGSVTVDDLTTDIRAERRIARQWKLAGTPAYVFADAAPETTAMTKAFAEETVTITTGDSVGFNSGIHSFVEAIELIGTGLEELGPDAFEVYISNDNKTYTKVTDVTLSRDKDTYRLTFPSIKCGWLKLYAAGADVNVSLANLTDGLAVYSSVEAMSGALGSRSSVEVGKNSQSETVFGTQRGSEGSFLTYDDGTLLMGYTDHESTSSGDFAETTLNVRTSEDGGYTWSDGRVVFEGEPGADTIRFGTYLWMENGDLAIIYRDNVTVSAAEGSSDSEVYIRRSSDGGKTWGERLKITTLPEYNHNVLSSGNRILRLPSGRILLATHHSAFLDDVNGDDHMMNAFWYSDDDGYTWKCSKDRLTLPNGASEPNVAILDDGALLVTVRTRFEGKIYQAISTDDGDTWAQLTAVENLVTPSATNTVLTIPATGDVALFWNNEYATDNGTRNPLTVAVSADHGLTYKNVRNMAQIEMEVPWPMAEFFGRSLLLQYGISTNLKIIDVAELYYTTSGKTTVADLPKVATPVAVYEQDTGWLTGVSDTMQYSLDNGETWVFAGGTSVLIDSEKITNAIILVKDIGTASTAPSDIQEINIQ